jgi:hypothetical protein
MLTSLHDDKPFAICLLSVCYLFVMRNVGFRAYPPIKCLPYKTATRKLGLFIRAPKAQKGQFLGYIFTALQVQILPARLSC